MLEILLIISLSKNIGAIVEAKGRRPGGYKALLAVMWFGGELTGGLVGGLLGLGMGAYLLALMGAAAGAFGAFAIAKRAAPAASVAVDPSVSAAFD